MAHNKAYNKNSILPVMLVALQFGFFSPPALAKSTCQQIFSAKSGTLNVEWLPFKKNGKIAVPEVLQDPFNQHLIASEEIRVELWKDIEAGQSLLTDYKQVTDAEPLYTPEAGPILLKDSNGQPITDPSFLTHTQLVKYVLINYKLPSDSVANKATFSAKEKRAHPPLLEALARQGLISKSYKDHPENIDGLIGKALQSLHETWEVQLRENKTQKRDTLLPMPKPYVVAGGRFREAYFWDSFWIMKGLIESGYGNTAKGMLENFVHLYEKYGNIPNGNRFYYLTRTQLPVFMEMVQLLESSSLLDFQKLANPTSKSEKTTSPRKGQRSLEARILKVAQEYYHTIWKGTDRFKAEFGLFAFSDGAGGAADHKKIVTRPEAGVREPRHSETHSQRVFAESGWDMSYSRFGKDPQNWLPVDLNMMLMGYTQKLSRLLEVAGQIPEAAFFKKEAAHIEANINKHLFDKTNGLYVDYNIVEKRLSSVITAASFFSFYFEIYPKTAQYKNVLKNLLQILKPAGHLGIHTTNTPGHGQWDGAWTWAPLTEMAFQGLLKYKLVKEARKVAFDYCLMTITVFHQNNHTFFEKYQSKDGAITLPKETEIYGNETGFGWTNGTVALFLRYLESTGDLPALEAAIAQRLKI